MSVEISLEPVSVGLPAELVGIAVSVVPVVVGLSEEPEDVESVRSVQLLIDIAFALERSVTFRLNIRP